jgi:hypothetical protein
MEPNHHPSALKIRLGHPAEQAVLSCAVFSAWELRAEHRNGKHAKYNPPGPPKTNLEVLSPTITRVLQVGVNAVCLDSEMGQATQRRRARPT